MTLQVVATPVWLDSYRSNVCTMLEIKLCVDGLRDYSKPVK